MKVPVYNMAGEEVNQVELPADIFEAQIRRGLMHQALVRQLANLRRGTHKAKSRGEIRLTGAKVYKQKGTGRARHGSRRAPIFVGGGVAHGPRPRSYAQQMPRKMRRGALRSALSAKAAEGEIVIVDGIEMDAPKTREMAAVIRRLTGGDNALLLLGKKDETVMKSARNLAQAKALLAGYVNVRDLLGHHKILMSMDALEIISRNLGNGAVVVDSASEEE